MPSESKPLLAAQTEKPNHYKYLKEFRVEQCPSFLQHKCTQHRPFTCFHWHFNNQRRRRPVRKRDGTFNYSADNYCTKYNETSGICEDGDECPYLHRTAGDTERRYHLRYYKTCMCVHDTDARGLCTKNGAHCAFAHGAPDLRPPVLDVRELQALENPDSADGDAAAPNALDRERNLQNEDPKWQDTNYVLSSYKTEPCKRPPRLCRQGYACPQYHNSKDKRRSPRKYKYRSTPCPNVKHGEEWGEPSNCEAGDACGYCHTRTEQQFHPEIYKSTKCNDVQQAGYCPRGLFCAFAHVEPEELSGARELGGPLEVGTNLAELLSSALPPEKKAEPRATTPPPAAHSNGSGDASECASTSSLSSASRAVHRALLPLASFGELEESTPTPPPPSKPAPQPAWRNTVFDTNVLHEVVGHALDEVSLEDPVHLVASLDRDLSDGDSLLSGSAPVNIPQTHSALRGFSPPSAGSPLPPFMRYANDTERLFNSHAMKASSYGGSVGGSVGGGGGSVGGSVVGGSVGGGGGSVGGSVSGSVVGGSVSGSVVGSSVVGGGGGSGGGSSTYEFPCASPELSRLREEVVASRAAVARWDERIAQARSACEAWKREADEAARAASVAERQRDDALAHARALRRELDAARHAPQPRRDLRGLPLTALKAMQAQARADLEDIEKVLYLETATKCMVCEEQPRSVTLAPCNHYVLCDKCAGTADECPYCQTPVQQHQ